jgi:phosphate:Na+ symporter
MAFEIAIGVFGGLGLFIYGMHLMAAGLQKAAGKRLERIIEALTKNKFIGVLVGASVTAIIQSSSATTVMVVGFVNAGIMNLTQAVGIIMGANIGTTMTAQIVSFNLESYAPIAVGAGMLMFMVSKNQRNKHIAEILLGFGILFIGMEFLKDSLTPLREIQAFKDLLISFGANPILGLLIGFMLTFVVQSSSASIGMLVALASQGLLPIEAALPILYGDNIGTCTTALISSIGTSTNAKRAAVMHLSFNVIGSLLFMILLTGPIQQLVVYIDPNNVPRQIANAHTFFNLINVIVQLPFAFVLIKIATWVVPDSKGDAGVKTTKYIDERILETPSIALNSAIKETLHMGNMARESFVESMTALFDHKEEHVYRTFEIEKVVNILEKSITDFLVKLSNKEITESSRIKVDGLFNAVNDIERIGDHADNIAELSLDAIEKRIRFSEDALAELREMYEYSLDAFKLTLESLRELNRDKALVVIKYEEKVDHLEKVCRRHHIDRLNRNECNSEAGIIFNDIISNIERVSDLSANIARLVLDTTNEA